MADAYGVVIVVDTSSPSTTAVAVTATSPAGITAARVVNAVSDLDVHIEQPCMSYDESVSIRRRTALPFVLDENIDGVAMLQKGLAEDAFDIINLKNIQTIEQLA